ncbi:protein smoothened [Condylostylus longicornis]|uniref:protein smoothened n=1 Tax=Condylostylus longicornis TaxID=2530218 RepID=UPI00244DD741|nr:protein smoothened [Condylostylus longicornis]
MTSRTSCILFMFLFWLDLNVALSINPSSQLTQTDQQLEPINGTINFRMYGKKGKDLDKPWYDGRGDIRHIQCVRPGRCETLNITTCFGAKISYPQTSLALTDAFNQEQIKEKLFNYQALQYFPKCWAHIQPFLCAVFVPKCEKIKDEDYVYLPSLEMCKVTLEPCRILYNTSYFPEFLKCNETLFPSKCNNDAREMKFNVTGNCLKPLVPTESSTSHFHGIEGCGIQCKDPLYTEDEHRQIHKLIAWGASICLLCNLFVIITFVIDWQNANKYPALIVFYINLCFAIASLGWLIQFTPGSRDDIVCKKDGTLRHSEPSAGENLSCIVVFVLVYYFLTSAMVWFVFLTYAWHLRSIGNNQDRIDKKGSYFHLVAWSLPLVLTITILALSEVDGNSTVGICFLGYKNHQIRAGLLLGPLCGILLIGGYFIARGMVELFALKSYATDIKSTSASNKIHLIIVRMGMCAMLVFVFICVTIACHINEFKNSQSWMESFRIFIICKISSTFTDEHKTCKMHSRPSVAILQLHLLCLFGSGIVMSSWCWTKSSIETWKRYIAKKFGREGSDDVKMPKHKVIAQTWAKRKEFEDKGRLSITLNNTRTDPVGLNFDVNDLNSSATNEISSTWVNYLPQFVTRRFALTGAPVTNSSSHGAPRKSSLDSEISFSVRHVSVESRRNSVDSQVSVKIAEMKTKVASRSRTGSHGSKKSKTRNCRRDFFTTGGMPGGKKFSSRKESSTSIESQIIAMKKTTGLFKNKNVKRRDNAVLDPNDINNFLAKNGRFIIPFLQNQGMTTTSDEESKASVKIQDSRLDVVMRQNQSDVDDLDDSIYKSKHAENYVEDDVDSKSLKAIIKRSTSFNNKDHCYESPSRNSKCSNKSRNSARKSNNHSLRRNRKNIKIAPLNKKDGSDIISNGNLNGSISSISSELDLPILHSSYSGKSITAVDRNLKPNSRNSCDVGIQTNAREIATQTLDSYEMKESKRCTKNNNNCSNRRKSGNNNSRSNLSENDSEGEIGERHKLLSNAKIHPTIVGMSESEKLKMLLLPSK